MISPRQQTLRRCLSRLKQQVYFSRQALRGHPVYMREVNLERVLIGEQCGTPLEQWVERSGEWDRVSCLVRDSPYVSFLTKVSSEESLLDDDAFLESHPYYRMGKTAVTCAGNYFGGTTPHQLKEQMRQFYQLFTTVRAGQMGSRRRTDHRHSAPGEPIWMSKVKDSHAFEISDGHHRAAVLYVLGKRTVLARIVAEKATYLQTLVHRSTGKPRPELLQPVDRPDVLGWKVRHDCSAQLRGINTFLSESGFQHKVRTALHLGCQYGWFVGRFRQQGMLSHGIADSTSHVNIGQLGLGLPSEVLAVENGQGLQPLGQEYDMLLFSPARAFVDLSECSTRLSLLLKTLDGTSTKLMIIDGSNLRDSGRSDALQRWGEHVVRSTSLRRITPINTAATNATQSASLLACTR